MDGVIYKTFDGFMQMHYPDGRVEALGDTQHERDLARVATQFRQSHWSYRIKKKEVA